MNKTKAPQDINPSEILTSEGVISLDFVSSEIFANPITREPTCQNSTQNPTPQKINKTMAQRNVKKSWKLSKNKLKLNKSVGSAKHEHNQIER